MTLTGKKRTSQDFLSSEGDRCQSSKKWLASKDEAVEKVATKKMDIFNLPTELVKGVLLNCKRKDLFSLCLVSKSCYLVAVPLLYQCFTPKDWTDLVKLQRQLRNGMGPSCFNRQVVAESIVCEIRSIELSSFQMKAPFRELDFVLLESVNALQEIVQRSKGLRSLHWDVDRMSGDYNELWSILTHRQTLQELIVSEKLPGWNHSIYGNSAGMWSLQNLTKIEIQTLAWKDNADHDFLPNLGNLLVNSPNLEHLKLRLCDGAKKGTGLVIFDRLFDIGSYSRLQSLDLENIQCSSDNLNKIGDFLTLLKSLKKLRFVQRHSEGRSVSTPIKWAVPREGASIRLPLLDDLEVTGLDNLAGLVEVSSPTIVRNVIAISDKDSDSTGVHPELAFLRDQASVQEFHLTIYGETHQDDHIASTVNIINCIPFGTKRLAIRMPFSQRSSPGKSYLRSLARLAELERLVLPWNTIAYIDTEDEYLLQELYMCGSYILQPMLEKRAKQLAKEMAKINHKLEILIFESPKSLIKNETGDPRSQVKFGMNCVEEMENCLIVKVTRGTKEMTVLESEKKILPEQASGAKKARQPSKKKSKEKANTKGSSQSAASTSEGKTREQTKVVTVNVIRVEIVKNDTGFYDDCLSSLGIDDDSGYDEVAMEKYMDTYDPNDCRIEMRDHTLY